MSQFSRRARWLNTIFPASVVPQTTDPASVSDDVSLVQPYDGGGVPSVIGAGAFHRFDTTSGASAEIGIIFTTGPEEIARIYAAMVFSIALGAAIPNCGLFISPVLGNVACALAETIAAPAVADLAAQFNMQGAGGLMVPPNHEIQYHYEGGTAVSTLLSFTVYAVVAPLGTVFYN